MLPTPLRQHLQTVKFRYSPPSTVWSLLFYTFGSFPPLWRRVVHVVLPAQCLWPSPGDLILPPVRWKRSLTWNQMLLRLLFDPLHTHSHTFGTVSSCPSTQKSYLHNPEKILSWLEPARNIVAHPLPQRGARMPEGSIFFCHVDVSFLIYRIFLM